MAPSDSRSVNRCGHDHLACKFLINVTVPGCVTNPAAAAAPPAKKVLRFICPSLNFGESDLERQRRIVICRSAGAEYLGPR